MNELLTGAVTGILFGFLMQKAQVIRYDRQLAALRLQDMTIVKFMLSTILVAMVGIYLLFDLGLIKLSVKPLILGGNVLGGLIFGIGWGIVGYCPATAMGALGEGRYDSAFGLLGMILGAGLYAEAYPLMKETVLTWGDFGKITLPSVLGINHWIVIVILAAAFIALFRWFEKKGL
ncbi:MAG: YeeE/YedE thiosulfate transporter family protein [Deltaproteobacteria bacterium]|nr:YeeE/YedE thiosulfate transporter family protein [Deltaproteobacteria bacterium]